MRQRVGEICGLSALALLCLAATMSVPARLMGMNAHWDWTLTACFIAGVWLCASMVNRPLSFGALLGLLVVASAFAMDRFTEVAQNDHKEIYAALWLARSDGQSFEWLPASPIELGALLGVLLLLVARVRIGRAALPRRPATLALAFAVCAAAALAIDALAYPLGATRFLDSLQVLFRACLLPLALAGAAVFLFTRSKPLANSNA